MYEAGTTTIPDMGEAGGGLVVITELPHSPPVYD